MPTQPVPRSRTGLIPTTHRDEMNRLTAPNQWADLPSRPPVVEYPFRRTIQSARRSTISKSGKSKPIPPHFSSFRSPPSNHSSTRKSSTPNPKKQTYTKSTQQKVKKGTNKVSLVAKTSMKGHKSTQKQSKVTSSTKNDNSTLQKYRRHKSLKKKEESWDTYCADTVVHQYNSKEQVERKNSVDSSLSYIRKSARRRELVGELEQLLDEEIAAEKMDMIDISCNDDNGDNSSSKGENGSDKLLSMVKNMRQSITEMFIEEYSEPKRDDDNDVNSTKMMNSELHQEVEAIENPNIDVLIHSYDEGGNDSKSTISDKYSPSLSSDDLWGMLLDKNQHDRIMDRMSGIYDQSDFGSVQKEGNDMINTGDVKTESNINTEASNASTSEQSSEDQGPDSPSKAHIRDTTEGVDSLPPSGKNEDIQQKETHAHEINIPNDIRVPSSVDCNILTKRRSIGIQEDSTQQEEIQKCVSDMASTISNEIIASMKGFTHSNNEGSKENISQSMNSTISHKLHKSSPNSESSDNDALQPKERKPSSSIGENRDKSGSKATCDESSKSSRRPSSSSKKMDSSLVKPKQSIETIMELEMTKGKHSDKDLKSIAAFNRLYASEVSKQALEEDEK